MSENLCSGDGGNGCHSQLRSTVVRTTRPGSRALPGDTMTAQRQVSTLHKSVSGPVYVFLTTIVLHFGCPWRVYSHCCRPMQAAPRLRQCAIVPHSHMRHMDMTVHVSAV